MTITPYTTPLQYEYKPLNLLAFAAPLSKMQEEFDLVTAAVDQADFDITHLPYGTDPEKAKELLKVVEGKRDELAKNLAETKNYKQAASKLKELNTLWQEDPELNALQNNYALFNKLDEAEKKRMDEGQIQRDQYYQWKNRMIRDYENLGGAAFKADYETPQGTYNKIGRIGRLQDLEKDLQELSWKVASSVPGTTREGALQEVGIDSSLMSKKFLQEIVEEKDANVVAKRVEAYLKTLPRFQNWAIEVADYNFDELQQDPDLYKQAAGALNNEYLTSLNNEIDYIKKTAKKNPDLLTTPDYKSLLEERDAATNAKTTGEYNDDAIKKLYIQKHLEDVYDMSALGKVFAYKNVKRDYSWRDLYIPPVSSGGSGGDGTDWSGLGGGFWKEAGEETLDYNTLESLKKNSSNTLNPITQNIGNLANGAVGRITIGTADSALYKKTKHNQALIWDNQQKLFNAITQSKGNANTLIAKAKEAGLTVSASDAKTLVSAFGKGEAIGDYQNLLEQGRSYRNSFISSQTAIDNMIRTTAKSGESYFGFGLRALDDDYAIMPETFFGVPDGKGGYTNITDKFEYLDQVQIAKGGKKWKQLAKEKGYNSLQEAVAAGEYFEDIKPGHIKAMFQVTGPSKDATIMTYEYIDQNDKVNKYVASMFSTKDDLLNLDPAYYSNWSDVPGFQEGDTGVAINISGNTKPRLVKAGDQILYEIPITWTDAMNNKQSGRVTVVPSTGLELQNQKVLRNMDIMSNTNDPADIQTNSTIKSARYDRIYKGNSLNDFTLKNTSVTRGGTPVTLDIVPYDGATSIIIEKTYDANSYGPKLKVAAINTTTGEKQYLADESGKTWYTDANTIGAADAAKAFVMKVMDPTIPK